MTLFTKTFEMIFNLHNTENHKKPDMYNYTDNLSYYQGFGQGVGLGCGGGVTLSSCHILLL